MPINYACASPRALRLSFQMAVGGIYKTRWGPPRSPRFGGHGGRSAKKDTVGAGEHKIKKEFTDLEKDEFRDEAFEYIANYFENSLAELKERNPEIDYRYRPIDPHNFTPTAYKKALGQPVVGFR